MDKEHKEKWILDKFLELYNRDFKTDYKFLKRVDSKLFPGPDFIIENSCGDRKGVEVTQLFEYPSEQKGKERHLEKYFLDKFYEKIDKQIYANCVFEFFPLPPRIKKNSIDRHIDEIIKNVELNKTKLDKNGKISIVVGGQNIKVRKTKEINSPPRLLYYPYSPDGITDKDRENYIKGIAERIKDKVESSKHYDNSQPNHLVIYDDADFSIFISNFQKEVIDKIKISNKGKFENIWLLESQSLYKLA